NIRGAGEDPRAHRGGTRLTIDSATGEVLQARETRGGSFLYRFHFELYGLPRIWARWIVGIATLLMLVAIISGVITHKKIFKDFFTFRPGKGQRSWLDAHNATAVFALPFHIMITFSGLLLLLFTLMPWGVNQIYENRGAFLQDQRKSLIQDNSVQAESGDSDQRRLRGEGESRGERGDMSARGEARRSRGDAPPARPAPLADLAPILAAAEKQWKNNPVTTINIIQPNTAKAEIELRALNGVSVA